METSPIFIGGFQRSGTTLMRYILESHPNIACGSETVSLIPNTRKHVESLLGDQIFKDSLKNFLLTEDDLYRIFARDPISAFFEKYISSENKNRWATKTPTNCLHFDFLARIFPTARFIHVIRDGRDCVCSLDKVPWFGNTLSDPVAFQIGARRWAEWTATGCKHGAEIGDRYMEVHYETLVKNPESEIRKILGFIGEPWDDQVLNHHKRKYTHEVGIDNNNVAGARKPIDAGHSQTWMNKMNKNQQLHFANIAGELLVDLGYELEPSLPRGCSYKMPMKKLGLNIRIARKLKRLLNKI